MATGISRQGSTAEDKFITATGATKSAKAGDGDAILGGSNVEIKKVSAWTLNQVRAVKYIPLVAYDEPNDQWYVIPAHVVVALVSVKGRGQHTENPFESATLNLRALGEYRIESSADLFQATLDAIAQAEAYPELKEAMKQVLAESKALAKKSVADVTEILNRLKISA